MRQNVVHRRRLMSMASAVVRIIECMCLTVAQEMATSTLERDSLKHSCSDVKFHVHFDIYLCRKTTIDERACMAWQGMAGHGRAWHGMA